MSNWMEIYDSAFFITIATIVTGAIGLSIRYCLKSKCDHINFCFGALTINRRVDLEIQNELAELHSGVRDISPPPSPNIRTNGNFSI